MSETTAPEHQPEAVEQPIEPTSGTTVEQDVQPAPQPAEKAQPRKAQFQPLGATQAMSAAGVNSIDMLMDVPMGVTVELGRTTMAVQAVLELQAGSVIELDHLAGEAVDIFINNHLLAKGEVVVVDDRFGVRVTQIMAATNGNGKGMR